MLSRRIIFGGIASATILATSVLGMTDAMAATTQSQAPAMHAVKADLVKKADGMDCSPATAGGPAGAATGAINGAAGAANGAISGVAGAINGVVNGVAGAAGHASGTTNGMGSLNGVVNGAAGAASGVVNGTSGLLNGLLCNILGAFGQQAGNNLGAK